MKSYARYLYFTVFAAGLTTLAIELSAARLLGPYFGVSSLVWATIIGLILIYLTVGYFLGGRWADRSPFPSTMYGILAWGAFTAGLIPYLSGFILRPAAQAFDKFQLGMLFGAFTVVLVLFIVPITLLGTISPFAIRLSIQDTARSGSVAGRIYAISTLGSFVGTFLPDLVLIPWLGTANTYLVFSLFLLVVAISGMSLVAGFKRAALYLWMPVILVGLAVFSSRFPIKDSPGQIYEVESTYNYIQVVEIDQYRYLRLNEGQGIHSIWHPTQIAFGGTWDQFLVAPFFNPAPYQPVQVQSMAIIGLAAGTTARQATEAFGPIPIDGFEIDAEIIRVAREYFDMNLPNLNAIAQDGRWGLARSERKYSIIGVDAYRPPYIPWHLTTREFFLEIYDHLEEDGALAINVGRAPQDRRLIESLVRTIDAVFPTVFVMDVPNSFNSIIYATVQPGSWENLQANYTVLAGDAHKSTVLVESLGRALAYRQPTPDGGMVFTDDRAPIEWLTHSLIFNFVIAGEMEGLQ
jgi:predicted membrane-bound spermidine synthase